MKRNSYSLVIITLLALLPGWAFAINFTPSASDPSVMYLSYIFGVVNGVLSGSGTQILGKMFNIFNMSVLMLGSIIAVYTTIMAVLNSGQDGEFMGKKWSSLFVPLRVLLGVLLIAPTTTGYSLIQVAVMWIVLQGVGAANYIWSEVLDYLNSGGTLFTSTSSSSSSQYSTYYSTMQSLGMSVFCLDSMNLAIQKLTSSTSYNTQQPAYQAAPSMSPFYSVMNTLTNNMYNDWVPTSSSPLTIPMPNYDPTGVDAGWSFLNGVCGQIQYYGGSTQTSSESVTTNTVPQGLQQALTTLNGAISPLVNNICGVVCPTNPSTNCSVTTYPYYSSMMTPPSGCVSPTGYQLTSISGNFPYYYWYNNSISGTSYANAVGNATNAFIGMVSTYSTGSKPLQGNTSDWLQAGNYFFDLMQYVGGTQSVNGATISDMYTATLPGPGSSSSIAWVGIPATNGSSYTYLSQCSGNDQSQGCLNYPSNSLLPQATAQQYLQGLILPLSATPNVSSTSNVYVVGNFLAGQENQGSAPPAPMSSASGVTAAGSAAAGIFAGGQDLYDEIAALTEITDTSTNPVIVMMNIGNDMINTAFNTWLITTIMSLAMTLAVSFIPSMSAAAGFLPLTNAIMSMVMALAVPLIAAGGMLLYYFPMVPFMIYAFGVVGWLFGVIEGMVAAPIVGIGIMHPDGHEVFGKGEQALMLLLNMFLRPSLMVFGLVVSIMLVYVSVWIINSGINSAIDQINSAASGFASGSGGMGYYAIPIVYTVIIFNVVTKCFGMIHILPDKVTRWLSGGMQESLGSDMAGMAESVKGASNAGMSAYGSAIGQGGGGHIAQSADQQNAGGGGPKAE